MEFEDFRQDGARMKKTWHYGPKYIYYGVYLFQYELHGEKVNTNPQLKWPWPERFKCLDVECHKVKKWWKPWTWFSTDWVVTSIWQMMPIEK